MYKALGSIPNTTKKKGGVRQWLYTKSGEKQRWEEKGMVDKPLAPALWKERQAVLQEFQASPVDTVSFRSTRTTKWRLSPQNKYISSRIEADWFSASLGTSTLNSILAIPVCTPTRMNNPFLSACVVILLILAIRVKMKYPSSFNLHFLSFFYMQPSGLTSTTVKDTFFSPVCISGFII